MTLIPSLSFVYSFFNLLTYSLVIKVAILVSRALLDDIIIPTPGLINPIAEELIVEADPVSISVIINNIFCFFSDFYIFSYNIHYQL